MEGVLIDKLHGYMVRNNPDLLIALSNERNVTTYLHQRVESLDNLPEVLLAEGKPVYIVEEICMEALTRDLRPSKFGYLSSVLHEEFESVYYEWLESGILTYEVINLLQVCMPVFNHFGFREELEDNSLLRNAIIGSIKEYVNDSSRT